MDLGNPTKELDSLLSCLNDNERKILSDKGQELTRQKHAFLYFPRDKADSICILVSGRVKVSNYSEDGREIIKEVIYPGDIFGEGFLAGSDTRRNYATAMDEEVTYICIGNQDLRFLMESNRQFAMMVMNRMGQKLREMEKRLEALTFKRSRARILDFIRESILGKCREMRDGTLVCPFLTHVDIAKMTDTSRQTVTLVLNELKKSELIDFDRKQIEIHDVAALCG